MSVELTLWNAVQALVGFFSVFIVILSFLSLRRKMDKFEDLADSVGGLLRYEESEDGEPLLDARVVKIIEGLGSSVAKSLKFSMLGQLSGPARLEKGLKSAMTQDVIDKQFPLVNLIGDFFGVNTQKYIAKHPDAIGQLAALAMPYVKGLMGNNGFQLPGQGQAVRAAAAGIPVMR